MIRLEGITGGILLRILAAGSFSLMSGLMKLAAEAGVTAPEMMFYRAIFGLPVVLAWVMMGLTIATTIGVPAASLMSQITGWRSAYLFIAAAVIYWRYVLRPTRGPPEPWSLGTLGAQGRGAALDAKKKK